MSESDPTQSRFLELPIDRRSMIKTVAAGGAAGLIASSGPNAASAAPAAQATGTTLTGSFYQSIPNPWQMSGNGLWTSLVYERLVSWNESYSEVIPALAESWTISDDGLVYTFKLRSGITWHDGAPFTADDIVWSYTTLLNPAITGTWVLPNLNPIKGAVAYKTGGATELPAVTALDELTVEITVEAATPLFLSQLAMPFILPKHLLENAAPETLFDDPYFTDSFVGLGPYKFQEWARDQFLTVVKHDAYYRGAPQIDTIIARFYESPSVDILAQQNNEVDAILLMSPDDIETVKADATLDVFPGPAMLAQELAVGHKIEQLKDKRVRQALVYAIDRQTIIDTLWKGTASVVNTPFLAEWVSLDGINPYAYDPEKAKSLLAEAGWPADATLDIWAYYLDPFTGQLLAALQQYLGDVGIKTAVQQTDFANIEADYNAGQFGLLYSGSSVGPDPDAMYIYFHSKSEYNTLWSEPTVDELLDAGRNTLDQAERAEIYNQLAVALNDQSFWVMLWTPLRHWAVRKTVSGTNGNMGTPGLHIPFYSKAETWTKTT